MHAPPVVEGHENKNAYVATALETAHLTLVFQLPKYLEPGGRSLPDILATGSLVPNIWGTGRSG